MGIDKEKFPDWRPNQREAVFSLVNEPKRLMCQAAPTGSGKSLSYMAASLLSGKRALVLTSTKALQDQIARDFAVIAVDVRGKNSYTCNIMPAMSAAQAVCSSGISCHLKEGGCRYYDALASAKESLIVITNYSMWMHICKFAGDGAPFGEFEYIFLDEAHEAPNQLLDFMSTSLDLKTLSAVGCPVPKKNKEDPELWAEWARREAESTQEEINRLKLAFGSASMKGQARLAEELALQQGYMKLLADIKRVDKGAWKIHWDKEKNKVTFGMLNLGSIWTEAYLFASIPKVRLLSATVRPETMHMLGFDDSQFEFEEIEHTFPSENSPIYHIDTLKVNKSTTLQEKKQIWVPQMDRIISKRRDRKGIIHCHSYANAEIIMEALRNKDILWHHNRYNTAQVVADFKAHDGGGVLLSPAMTTGYDFPGNMCEYQVIVKTPFPYFGDKVFRERLKKFPMLSDYITAQTLVQIAGRGTRFFHDRCETFIIDNIAKSFIESKAFEQFPYYFHERYQSLRVVPAPPERITRQ